MLEFLLSGSTPCSSRQPSDVKICRSLVEGGLRHYTRKDPRARSATTEVSCWNPYWHVSLPRRGGLRTNGGWPNWVLPCSMVGVEDWGLSLCTRKYVSGKETPKRWNVAAILFADIRSAFYTVAKPLLTGFDGTEESVANIFRCLKLPPSAYDAFKANIHEADLIRRATDSDLASAHIQSSLAQTWFVVPGASELRAPQTGSRPGDPLADLLFGLVLTRVLEQTNEQLLQLGLVEEGMEDDEPFSTCVTWVDDIAIAVYAPASEIAAKAATAASVLLDVMTEHGLTLALGVGKTALMMHYYGKEAHKSRQRDEQAFADHLPVMVEHGGRTCIPLVSHYRHLGGQITKQGNALAEIRIRKAQTMQKLGPLKKFLQEERFAIDTRRTLVVSMGLSVMSLHAGTWFKWAEGEFGTWQGAIHTAYQTLKRFNPEDANAHMTVYELAKLANSPTPMELLFLARIRVFLQILQVEDDMIVGAVLHNFHCAKEQSWLAGLETACIWMAEQRGREGLPDSLFDLHNWDAWKDLRKHVRVLRKAAQQAKQAHLMRVRVLCALEEHAKFQDSMLVAMGSKHETQMEEEADLDHVCGECGEGFPSPAALAVHMNRKHGERHALRRYTCDSICRIRHKQYHTRMRLLTHLHCGGTGCWIQLMRNYHPMTEEEAQCLDDLDREQGYALHQKGLRNHETDKKWRHCTADELMGGLDPIEHESPQRQDEPTPEELQAWTKLGALPTGQGGRDKTKRAGKTWRIFNVAHDTRLFEQKMVKRSKHRSAIQTAVPPPLSEGRKCSDSLLRASKIPGHWMLVAVVRTCHAHQYWPCC